MRWLGNVFERLNRVLSWIEQVLGSIALVLMTSLALYQVFVRYVLNRPSTWSEDAAIQSFAWLVMVGAAYAYNRREHVAMDLIFNQLPARLQLGLALGSDGLVLATAAYTFWVAYRYVFFIRGVRSPGLGISWGWLFASAAVSMALIALHALGHLVFDLEKWRALGKDRP